VCAGLYVEPAAGSAGPVEPSPAALAAARAASHAEASTSDAAHLTDLSYPASWYPAARGLERTIVAHVGPTNSGKTHTALKALAAAGSGVYCGPLRLLASEARAPICRSVFVPFGTGCRLSGHVLCLVRLVPGARPAEGGAARS